MISGRSGLWRIGVICILAGIAAYLIVASAIGATGQRSDDRRAHSRMPAFAITSPAGSAAAAVRLSASCATGLRSMIRSQDLRSFVTDVSQKLTSPPFKGVVQPSAAPLFVRDFVVGRIEGFLSRISLVGRFRAAENAQAAKLHYPVRRLPYVPLTGLVVRANPRQVLEVYETRMAFTAPAGAQAWILSVRHETPGTRALQSPHNLGDRVWAFRSALGPSSNFERVVTVLVQTGNVGTEINVQGGLEVPTGPAFRLARAEYSQLLSTCQSASKRSG